MCLSRFVRLFVEGFLQCRTGFEKRDFFGWDIDGFFGARVAPTVCPMVFVGEGAEAPEFDPIVVVEGLDDGPESDVDDHFRLILGQMTLFRQCRN